MSWQSPQTWKTATLADICYRIVDGSHNPPTGQPSGKPMLSAKNIQNGKIHFDELRLLSNDDFELENNRTNISAGDVLLTIVGAIGRTAVVPETAPDFTLQRSVAVLKSNFINPNYLRYLLDSPTAQSFFLNNAKGTAQKGIYLKALGGMQIPVAPPEEQTRIAQKLDELLGQVDILKARIDGIPVLLKRFRQSVLASAVSGRLTMDWRDQQDKQPSGGELAPAGWTQTVFGEICREITVGYVGKMADQYQEEGVPFLRSQNVRPMRFSPENILYISKEFHSSIFKSRLEPGDLAVVRSGAPGVTCVIPESLPIANCSDLVIARPSEKLNSWFGCIYMNSEVAQRNVAENQVGVAQQHFNVGSMKKMPINLPPLTEQTEIVRRVEQLFAFADQLDARVKAAQVRIDRLTQSILVKAFRGELMPQEPNDEPASVLLERIKVQRAAAPKARRGRKALA